MEEGNQGDYDWGLILESEKLEERLGELGLSKNKEIIIFSVGPKGWEQTEGYFGH